MTSYLRIFFASITIVLLACLSSSAMIVDSQEKDTKIEIEKKKIKDPTDRSVSGFIEVYYRPSVDTIEIICFDMGLVTAYILDQHNNIHDYLIFDSAVMNCVVLDAPQSSGMYFLVIDGFDYQGEGLFFIE